MARQKSDHPRKMSEASKQRKAAYDMQYAKSNIVRKFIPFNKTVSEEAKMLDWLDGKGQGKMARYVKDLIYDDMKKSEE